MAVTIADYQVLLSEPLILARNGPDASKDLEFVLPDDFVVGGDKARPILQFMVRAFEDDVQLLIMVNHNTHVVFDRRFDSHPIRTHSVVIDGNLFNHPIAQNTIRLRAQAGNFPPDATSQSLIQIENVVLWYQRRIQL